MYSLYSAYHGRNVILGDADMQVGMDEIDAIMEDRDGRLEQYCKTYSKYIHISKRIEKKFQTIYEQLFPSNARVLGCVFRGTDYRNREVVGEHRQLQLLEEIKKARELMEEWHCDYVFLATEDSRAAEVFKESFGDKLICEEKQRIPSDCEYAGGYHFEREDDEYLKGESYLTDIWLLSKCTCLLSSRVGILLAALPMNNMQYEHKYIYDLGFYTEEDYKDK